MRRLAFKASLLGIAGKGCVTNASPPPSVRTSSGCRIKVVSDSLTAETGVANDGVKDEPRLGAFRNPWPSSEARVVWLLDRIFFGGAPGRTRTCDARFRKPTLYPLSYGG